MLHQSCMPAGFKTGSLMAGGAGQTQSARSPDQQRRTANRERWVALLLEESVRVFVCACVCVFV